MGSLYEELGASATKADIHDAISMGNMGGAGGASDAGEFPTAFCRLAPDVLAGDPQFVSASHADGAGTKALLAYLIHKETGNARAYRGPAHDALVMNLDDLACVGAAESFLLANTIGRNSRLVPKEAIAEIIAGYNDACRVLAPFGVRIVSTGGETADLGDSVRTLVVDCVLTTRLPRSQVIDAGRVRPGDVIVGLSSVHRSFYEDRSNSGIGSNGLTLARHLLLSEYYREKYPETVAPETAPEVAYRGKFRLEDRPVGLGFSVGEALSSPTRTYAPIVRQLVRMLPGEIHGIIHNTGGGLGKSLRFGSGVHYIKDAPFACPPVFKLIADAGVPAEEMVRTFNLGCRMEVIVAPARADIVVETARRFGVDAKVVGRCEATTGVNRVTAASAFGTVLMSANG